MSTRPTMREVAELAGVSRTTVSFVLNNTPNIKIPEETRQRVLSAVQELNYVPNAKALTLATGRTNTIALVLRQTPHQISADALLGEVLLGLNAAVKALGFHVLVYPIASGSSYANLARSQKVDGLVLSGPTINDEEWMNLHRENFPVVLQGACECVSDIASVDIDNAACAQTATEHLIALGHRRIAHITNAPLTYTAARARLEGYKEALKGAGITYDDALIAEGTFTAESGSKALEHILKKCQPTALFVGSDVVALGVLEALKTHGMKVPDDVSIVGFDDIPLVKHLDPGLTTIHLPAWQLGKRAGHMLMKLLRKERIKERRVLLEAKLVIRESTGPPAT